MFLWDLNISFQFSTTDPERCQKIGSNMRLAFVKVGPEVWFSILDVRRSGLVLPCTAFPLKEKQCPHHASITSTTILIIWHRAIPYRSARTTASWPTSYLLSMVWLAFKALMPRYFMASPFIVTSDFSFPLLRPTRVGDWSIWRFIYFAMMSCVGSCGVVVKR